VLARRWKTDTAALRLADSLADTVFNLCVAAAIALEMPGVWHPCRSGVLAVLGCEAVRFAVDLAKFGKPASYHSYLAKTWGLVLAAAVMVTFETQRVSVWMIAAVVLGVLSNAESLAMSLVLPVWRGDVKTLALAWRIRAGLLRERVQASAAIGLGLAFCLLLSGSRGAQAQSLQHVTYVGGTVLPGTDLHGKISVAAPDTLLFEGPSKIVVPYDHVISYESASHKKVPVGLLTEGIWRLVAPWPESKRLSLSYRDSNEHSQVMVLDMSREDEAVLVEVLKTRVPRPGERTPAPLVRPHAH
jgi:CDP-diacylglycerol--glycerol-3-phosphate 3-phosphatidyltransferase